MGEISDAGPRLRAMNDALEENDRLRAEIDRLTLTDAEREAVRWAIFEFGATHPDHGMAAQRADTLRKLLERTA